MSNEKDYLIFGSPQIGKDEIKAVRETLKSKWIGTGPRVTEFENKFKLYKNSKNAAAVNSCTAALHLSLLSLGVSKGDEVITSPLTFCSTINSIIHAGANPIIADIDPKTMNICPNSILEKISKNTKCIIPVHFAGRPCDMDNIMKIAKEYGIKVVEDCAHAIETMYKGKTAGSIGDMGCFSFYVTKNLTTGEGGMILTNQKKLISRIRRLSLHGMDRDAWKRFGSDDFKHYLVREPGFKYNMTDMQASLGLVQLNKIEKNWKKRKKVWEYYNDKLKYLPITLPSPINDDIKHGYHLYTIQINKKESGISRNQFLSEMHKHKIGLAVHYLSMPEHPYYKKELGWKSKDFPNAKKVGRETASLILTPDITKKNLDYIVDKIKYIFHTYNKR